MSDYASIEKEIYQTNPKNYPKWNKDKLTELLIKICDDIENCKGPISYFELPDYLKEFWADHSKEYYENQLKNQRYQKYLELKKEFGN